MATGSVKQDLSSVDEFAQFNDMTDFEKSCMYVSKECNHHEQLLEAVQSLVKIIEVMKGHEMSQPNKLAEIYTKTEEIIAFLTTKPAVQTPILDQLLGELQNLKHHTPSSSSNVDQWRRMGRIEENLVHVMADVGYDILSAIRDLQSTIHTMAKMEDPKLADKASVFSVDPKFSKQHSITKYLQFLRKTSPCVGKCHCNAPAEQTYPLVDTYHSQKEGQLDRKIHVGSPMLLYEVCPIEMEFKNFESIENVRVIINFAASASYTNFMNSIFMPNHSGPNCIQIPWMKKLKNVYVLGKVAAEICFFDTCKPIIFQMNVIDWTNQDEKLIIFGRDFVDEYVKLVHHERHTVYMRDPSDDKKVFHKHFGYLTDVLQDIETRFCRYRLNNELQDARDIRARIERLQKVLEQRDFSSCRELQLLEHQKKDSKSSDDEQNAEKPDRNPSSDPQNLEKSILKSSVSKSDLKEISQQMVAEKDILESNYILQGIANEQAVKSVESQSMEKERSNLCSIPKVVEDEVPSFQFEINEKQNLGSNSSLKELEKGKLKSSSQTENVEDVIVSLLKESEQSEHTKKLPSSSFPLEHSKKDTFVNPSSQQKNIEIDSKQSLHLKRASKIEEKPCTSSKNQGKMCQECEETLEEKCKPEDQAVDTRHLKKETIEKSLMFSTGIRHVTYRLDKSERVETEPCYSNKKILILQEPFKVSTVEIKEKCALDPTRTRPPVVTKKEKPKLTEVSSLDNKSEVLKEKNRKSPPKLECTEKEELEQVFQYKNLDQQNKYEKLILPTPEIENIIQEEKQPEPQSKETEDLK